MIRVVGDPTICAKHKEKAEGVCPGCFGVLNAHAIIFMRLVGDAMKVQMPEAWMKKANSAMDEWNGRGDI